MIEASLTFIDKVNKEFSLDPKIIIDIGSMDRNLKIGARAQFPDSQYIGIDFEMGDNVDFVMDAYELKKHFKREYFDAVLCLHLFEHIAKPWKILKQIDYILSQDGLLYISIPTIGYPLHGYPGDYWRVTEQCVREVIFEGYEVLFIEHAKSTYNKHPFINGVGRKL